MSAHGSDNEGDKEGDDGAVLGGGHDTGLQAARGAGGQDGEAGDGALPPLPLLLHSPQAVDNPAGGAGLSMGVGKKPTKNHLDSTALKRQV